MLIKRKKIVYVYWVCLTNFAEGGGWLSILLFAAWMMLYCVVCSGVGAAVSVDIQFGMHIYSFSEKDDVVLLAPVIPQYCPVSYMQHLFQRMADIQ